MRLLIIARAVILPILAAERVRAAFILDDYDDPAQTVMESFFDSPFGVTTAGVGDLAASRRIAIIGRRGDPLRSLDANVTAPSMLTAIVSELNPTPTTETDVFVWWDYEFSSTDFSQSGQNNALFFDFGRLTAEKPPYLLRMTMDGDDNGLYLHDHYPVLLSSSPFTIVVPFSEVAPRGDDPWISDMVNIHHLHVELWLFGSGDPDPINLHMELDRIRVGRIPEPRSLGLAVLVLGIVSAPIRRPS